MRAVVLFLGSMLAGEAAAMGHARPPAPLPPAPPLLQRLQEAYKLKAGDPDWPAVLAQIKRSATAKELRQYDAYERLSEKRENAYLRWRTTPPRRK